MNISQEEADNLIKRYLELRQEIFYLFYNLEVWEGFCCSHCQFVWHWSVECLLVYRWNTGGDYRFTLRPSVCPLKSGSFDNLKTIKARRMKLCTCIGSNLYNMHAQNLGRYLEGQGHSMTLKQNHVRSITLIFEVGFKNYCTEMITILRWFVTTLPILWLCDYYTALY